VNCTQLAVVQLVSFLFHFGYSPCYASLQANPIQKGSPMQTIEITTSDAAILARVLEPKKPTFPVQAARAILALDFSESDKDHMRQHPAKARLVTLTLDEQVAIQPHGK
jgi:hypothetical protein